jgi:hypothetical protein
LKQGSSYFVVKPIKYGLVLTFFGNSPIIPIIISTIYRLYHGGSFSNSCI